MSVTGSSRSLLTRFEVGQGSVGLYARLDVGQDSAGLLGKGDVQQSGSAELLGNAEVTHSVDLLSKGDIRQLGSAELLGKAVIKNIGSADLLGEASITHSTELLCNAIIENISSAALYARAEVGQDSEDLFAKFEAQDTQVLYAKGEVRQADLGELYARAEVGQGSGELFAKAEVGQGSVELFGRGIVRNVASSDLKGIVDITHSIDLLGRAVIGHPALPAWLKVIFSIGLTNAYRDLGSISELRHDGTPVELLGKAVVRQSGSAELLGKGNMQQSGSAELLGRTEIRNIGSAELLCGFASQKPSDLRAKLIIGPAKNSDAYFSFYDPSDWINEVVGVGQGFITIPWVEADADVKTVGDSSARLTSNYAANQYKEIRFGWGGMNWGLEAAVSPEIAPTPIDTGGRSPRRGSRAQRDQRREVPQSSYKELKAQFYVDMAILPGGLWDYQYVWQNLASALEVGVLQGQIEIDPATGAITARQRHAINDRSIITMCGGYRAYSKGTFTFDAEASIYSGANPIYTPAFGLVENKYDWFTGGDAHAAMLYADGAGNWYFYTEDDGDTESTPISGIDFTARHTYIIDWEDATEFPATGRVRLWIDGDLKATHTVAVPTNPLLFFLLMDSYIVAYSAADVWTTMHSFNVTGDV